MWLVAVAALALEEELTLRQHAVAGALARCAAQSAVHPLNVAKTVLQTSKGGQLLKEAFSSPKMARITFSRGLGAQALLSLPNGAVNFWALEFSRRLIPGNGPLVDVLSASVGTALGTFVSLPQSILNDGIMSGKYANLRQAVRGVGWKGLYPPATWRAALISKVPAYALNWACYQELRRVCNASTPMEDLVVGALASSISVCVMIPLDTVKVRMTTGNFGRSRAYRGVTDCVTCMLKDEGIHAFYRGLPPRLLSVVPMTAIQFTIYELAKRRLPSLQRQTEAAYEDFSTRVHAARHWLLHQPPALLACLPVLDPTRILPRGSFPES